MSRVNCDVRHGLANTLGVAGFPSGEAYKIGNWKPYYRMPRAFLRQTFALREQGPVESGPNALADTKAVNNVTLTMGTFAAVDIFDTSSYTHDPRADFLKWAVVESGAFDYAADSWGYTIGATIEWTQGDWMLRSGYLALSTMPNGDSLQTNFSQNSVVGEVEPRLKWMGRAGAIRGLAFVDRGSLATYEDAIGLAASTQTRPDPASVHRGNRKSGYSFNLEQEIVDGVGVFARFSVNIGKVEAIEFTEINRSIAAGLSIKGSRWHRGDDTVGIAAAVNGVSSQAQAYFVAGGNGISIGDGQLPNSASEQIVETYYAARLSRNLTISVELQHIANPAYNADRGPVKVFGLRVHAEF